MIDLIDYNVEPDKTGNGLRNVNFSLLKGDCCAIRTDSSADAALFLKALSTLVYPVTGTYRFKNQILDFMDYRTLLPVKKKIGYMGQDAAMISNMSIRDNLLLMRHYHENSLELELDGVAAALCDTFQMNDKLDKRPGELKPSALRLAVAIRELSKGAELLFLEYPEEYFGWQHLDLFTQTLKNMPLSEMGIVFISERNDFLSSFANRHISLSGGCLSLDENPKT